MVSKKALIPFLLLLLIPSVLAEGDVGSIWSRIASTEKVPYDGVCDDGENYLLDSDCAFSMDDLNSGEVFSNMWFLRFMILLLIFAFTDHPKAVPYLGMFFMGVLVYNGLFNIPFETKATGVCDVTHLGECLFPNNPIMGWVLVGVMGFVLYKLVRDV